MISRAGKFTQEIHMILQHQDEILQNTSPKKTLTKTQSAFRLNSVNERNKEENLFKQINFIQQEKEKDITQQKKLAKSASHKDRLKGKQWMFGAISRDNYYSVKKPKFPNPPCGAYNINYD